MSATVQKTVIALGFEAAAPRESVRRALERLHLGAAAEERCRFWEPGLISIHADGLVPGEALDDLAGLPGVTRVVTLSRRLHERELGAEGSVVRLAGGVAIGGRGLVVIAGPCSVESESQICSTAAAVKEAGATVLRGGAFKPRTSPYSFGGLGERGLEALARAREETGLPFVTEVLDSPDVDLVASYADMLQIGSRNMQNTPLLFKAGRHPSGKPVLLKRGFGATVDELLEAAEYVLLGRFLAGHPRGGVVLCERGIRTFETSSRFTLDVAAIPILRERSHLPVIVDPSHPAGARRLVSPLARAAVAAGAQGLLVEVHPDPARAWSDAAQCLDPAGFRQLMGEVAAVAAAVGAG